MLKIPFGAPARDKLQLMAVRIRRSTALLAALIAAGLLGACATPVGVERVDARTVHRELTASVLSTDQPSPQSVQVLHRLGLFDAFARDPDAALAQLHDGLAASGDEDRLFALAELSFLRGEAAGSRARRLAAAVYAYAFLFPETGSPPEPFDPRFRLASELYNLALTRGLAEEDGVLRLEPGNFKLPFGVLEVQRASREFSWAGHPLIEFQPAADVRVRGLRNRYRRSGIGAPLSAKVSREFAEVAPPPGHDRIPPGLRIPTTALLRIEAPRRGLSRGILRGSLELYSADDVLEVEIAGKRVPLEFETTSSLALSLEGSDVWEFERKGFFSGEREIFGEGRAADGLMMMHPYRPGRIPVVLVHGTVSSPARWAELVNELENDPRIWERYQVWLYAYNTGNPVALSGKGVREALHAVVKELDPDGKDPALRRMVVIGHSQGGLLTKLTVVDSGDHFWASLSDTPIEEFEISSTTRDTLEQAFFFEPVPFVKRVVFVCTPHRGSYLTAVRFAGLRPARWAASLVRLPATLVDVVADLAKDNQDARLLRRLERIPTSIDNMTPGNPFLQHLADTPIADGVTAHSIIAVDSDAPLSEAGDGVVKYSSAHIEGVASELVVHSGHSAQAHPNTIEEIRRILLEHAAAP